MKWPASNKAAKIHFNMDSVKRVVHKSNTQGRQGRAVQMAAAKGSRRKVGMHYNIVTWVTTQGGVSWRQRGGKQKSVLECKRGNS